MNKKCQGKISSNYFILMDYWRFSLSAPADFWAIFLLLPTFSRNFTPILFRFVKKNRKLSLANPGKGRLIRRLVPLMLCFRPPLCRCVPHM